jgi:uncharacterized protein YsxB (DUF464 family)
MIRARFTENRLTVFGHAGYAEKGQDVVCAAVSALVYALAGTLEEQGRAAELVIRPGYATVAARERDPAFDVVRKGLEQLEGRYPGHVRVE